MKVKSLVATIAILTIALLGCLYQLVNLAIENDSIRQGLKFQKESISILLDYSAIASRCDVSAQEIAAQLNKRHPVIHFEQRTNTIAGMAFFLAFKDDRPSVLGITDNQQVNLCQQ